MTSMDMDSMDSMPAMLVPLAGAGGGGGDGEDGRFARNGDGRPTWATPARQLTVDHGTHDDDDDGDGTLATDD